MKAARDIGAIETPSMAAATDTDGREDIAFFDQNPSRRFRVGERFVTRHCGSVFLRAPCPPGSRYPDNEPEAERLWWLTAWPELDPKTREALMKAARQRGFSGKKRT